MTTYQSTSLHVEDVRERSLAFTVADNPAEDDYALKAWSTQILADGQVVNVEVEFTPDDVRDLQAYLRDRFGAGVASRVRELPESAADTVKTALNNLLLEGYRIIAPNGEAEASLQTQLDNSNAQYFRDGWAASLRELLAMSKVRGYEEAINWAKGQLGGQVNPVTGLSDAPHQVEYEPTTGGELPGMWEQSDFSGGEADTQPARQCAVIYNGVQCSKVDWHVNDPATSEHTFFTDQPPVENHTPQDLSNNPHSAQHPSNQAPVSLEPSEAEKSRRRRLKVEMEFDDALEAHLAAPSDETWDRLSEAFKAVHKREPDNSRVRLPLVQRIGASSDAAPTLAEAQRAVPDSVPVVGFAPEPPAGTPVPWAEGPAAVQAGANYLEQSQHPMIQQFHEAAQALPGVHVQDSVIMTPEQAAAAAFPCPQRSQDGRACQRPFGHELQTATNPEPKPHVYATLPSQLTMPADGYANGGPLPAPSALGVTSAEAAQAVQQSLPALQGAGQPMPTGPLSFQIPPTPGPAPVRIPADANQQPPAPAAPFWQQPQGGQ